MDELKEHLKNNAAPLDAPPPAEARVPPQLVAAVESLLADVKAGNISSFAAITVSPQGRIQWPAFGMQVSDLYIGASCFQRAVEQMVTGQAKSRILRPG